MWICRASLLRMRRVFLPRMVRWAPVFAVRRYRRLAACYLCQHHRRGHRRACRIRDRQNRTRSGTVALLQDWEDQSYHVGADLPGKYITSQAPLTARCNCALLSTAHKGYLSVLVHHIARRWRW